MGRTADTFDLAEGPLPRFTGKTPFANQRFQRFGRLDRYSKLGIQAIGYALQDAGLDIWAEKRDTGVIASSVFGCLATDSDYYKTVMVKDGILADPNLFTHTLPNSFLGHASITFGLTGVNFVLNDKTGSGLPAMLAALDCISLGECSAMVAGICDVERQPDLLISGKQAPGSIFMVLEKTIERQRQPYGRLSADSRGTLYFDKSEITDISMCVRLCLNQ
jgi:3-oxoacyl-[acyl-carrier-protein] synthase II